MGINEDNLPVFVIESGEFDIFIKHRKPDGVTLEDFFVATIGGGTEFGMMEHEFDCPRLGTVIVNENTNVATCWKCEPEDVRKFVETNDLLSKRMRKHRLLYKSMKETDLLRSLDPNTIQHLIYNFE